MGGGATGEIKWRTSLCGKKKALTAKGAKRAAKDYHSRLSHYHYMSARGACAPLPPGGRVGQQFDVDATDDRARLEAALFGVERAVPVGERRSEEHTSELQS